MTPATVLCNLWREQLFPVVAGDDRPARYAWPLVLLLPALLLYPWLHFHLLEPDEARYAQISREMLARHDYVVPHLQGEPYLDKPPLVYWLVMLAYSVGGVCPAAARVVPALAVHATIVAVYGLGRRSVGRRAALAASLMLCASPLFIGVARLLLLDGVLTLWVTLSLLCGYEAVRTGTFQRRWWLAAALASGLGFLTKGPISELLLFPPLFVAAVFSGGQARLRWPDALSFAAVVAAVNAPWYVVMYRREPAFVGHFFWEHNVMRFLQPFDHLQPAWYYLPILAIGLLPAAVLLPGYARSLAAGRPERSAAGGFWLLAGGWCVLFFTVSGSKLPTYILPALPAVMLAVGDYAARLSRPRWPLVWILMCYSMMMILHSIVVPYYAQSRSPVGEPELLEPLLRDPTAPVVTYPRQCNSVAYFLGRDDFDSVRSKGVNDLIVAMHHRPRTVVLFTHRHSYEAFREALPDSLAVAEAVSLHRKPHRFWDRLAGDTPWGLTDIAVIQPAAVARGQKP